MSTPTLEAGKRVINMAREQRLVSQEVTSSGIRFIDANSFLKIELPEPRWLVENILSAGGCCFIAGAPKSMKSCLGLDLALAVVSGSEFLGHQVEREGEVLLIDAETPRRRLQERIQEYSAGRQVTAEQLRRLHVSAHKNLNLGDTDTMAELRAQVEDLRPALIVLDPMREFHLFNEDSSTEIQPLLGELRTLTYGGATLVVVHHVVKEEGSPGKRKGALLRGSSALWAWYDEMLFLKSTHRTVQVDFDARYCEAHPSIKFNLDCDGDGSKRINVLEQPVYRYAKAEEVVSLLKQNPAGLTQTKIANMVKANRSDAKKILQELSDRGDVVCVNDGRHDVWRVVGLPTVPPDGDKSQSVPPCPGDTQDSF